MGIYTIREWCKRENRNQMASLKLLPFASYAILSLKHKNKMKHTAIKKYKMDNRIAVDMGVLLFNAK